jgi:hypothetical protein
MNFTWILNEYISFKFIYILHPLPGNLSFSVPFRTSAYDTLITVSIVHVDAADTVR